MSIVRLCRENQRAIYLLTALLLVAGLVAAFNLPSNIYPELTFPRIVVLAHSGDLAPDSMLVSVTKPIEESVSTVPGVRRVRSRTIRGGSEISVLFAANMDMQYALQLVQGKVNDVRGNLPAETEVEVERLTPSVWPILSFVLNGDVPGTDLRDHAIYSLKPLISRVPGVGQVAIDASDAREISVVVDPQKASSHHLSLPDIADKLRSINGVTSVGKLDKDYSQYLLLSTSQFTDVDSIRDSVIAIQNQSPVRLRDIADVRDGVQDRRILVSGNGRPAALINVTRQVGGNIIQISDDVKTLARHTNAIPPTLHLSIVYDLAEFVQSSIGNVRDAILIGSLLAVLVLFVFLREGRTTIIAAITLPLTVIVSFFVMRMFGGTINLMSMGGLAIAIGLVIDDAVVVIENIYRHIGRGEPAQIAAEKGTQELLGPVIGSTLTTVVVFIPLGLLKGAVGEFFSALSLTLTASVLLSLLFAVTIIPLLSQRFLSPERYRESSSRFIEPVYRQYEKAVRWSLSRKKLVAVAGVLVLAIAALLYMRVETGFLPEMDEGGFVIDYLTPPGTSLSETDRMVKEIELRVKAAHEVASFSRRTGAELGIFATEQNKGDILVKLKPRSQRDRDINEIISDLRGQIKENIPGIQTEFLQILQDMIGDLEGNPEPIEVKLFGSDLDQLDQLAQQVGAKIEKIPGVVDFKGVQKGNPEIVFKVDAEKAGKLGLSVDQVSQQVRSGLLGITPTELRKSDRTIPIRLRFPDSFRYDINQIRQFPVIAANNQIVPFGAIAEINEIRGQNQLLRENQRLMVVLTARLENRDLGSAIQDVKKIMSTTALPTGYTFEIGGQYESQQSSFSDLFSVLALALAAVFTVLVIQFRAFTPSLVIMSAAPLSLFGVFAMLNLTGTALNVSSFMGIILMVGLVVKNGIILFEYVQHLREKEGLDLEEALVQAGRIRVRPILMTTLCTLFGLLPLALGLGSGAELQKPLALAVIGGLLLSTFITLLVMPVFYAVLESRSKI